MNASFQRVKQVLGSGMSPSRPTRPRAKQKTRAATTVQTKLRLPSGAVAANAAALVHNNTYGQLPTYYVDRTITCRECGTREVWKAERQKWWYEVAKGNINSQAVRCRACRRVEKAGRDEARRVHLEGIVRKKAKT